jgi:hypothetical protein
MIIKNYKSLPRTAGEYSRIDRSGCYRQGLFMKHRNINAIVVLLTVVTFVQNARSGTTD